MKRVRPQVDINIQELDQIIDRGTQAPLSESDGQKLKDALHIFAELLSSSRSTEKTKAVLAEAAGTGTAPQGDSARPQISAPGHGRNGAAAFTGAQKIVVQHAELKSGDRCPECEKGKVYTQKQPKPLVRIVGQAPLAATVYELERLRCNACGQVFTAEEPGQVRRDHRGHDCAAQVRLGCALLSAGKTGG